MKLRSTLKAILMALLTLSLTLSTVSWGFGKEPLLSETGEPMVEETTENTDLEELDEDLAPIVPGMRIKRVEVVDGGQVQAKYRDGINYDVSKYTVYKGDHETLAVNGEDPEKYYTTAHKASLLDRRNFTVEIVIPKEGYTDIGDGLGEFNPDNVKFTYMMPIVGTATGNNPTIWHPMGAVIDGKVTGETITGLTAEIVGDFIFIEATISFASSVNAVNSGMNIPYFPYYSKGGANANDWARTGDWDFTATYSDREIGSIKLRMALNDSHRQWSEMDAFAKDYIAKYGPDGGTEFSSRGRFMKMESLGKTRLGRDIWASIIADSKESLDEYLNVTVPLMNRNPALLQSQLAGGNQKQVLMFNGIHGGEVTGNGVMPDMMDRLLQYKTLRYTDTAEEETERHLPTSFSSTGGAGTTQRKRDAPHRDLVLDVDAFLDKYIVVIVYYSNADGNMTPIRQGYYASDPNRDGGIFSFIESRHMARAMTKYDPTYVMEFHGYVTNYLIDATTPPTEPSLEVDLIEENVLKLVDAYGRGGLGKSAYDRYNAPMRDMPSGWDTAAIIYTPAMAFMWGSLGTTVEFARSGQDDVDVGVQGVFALFDYCLEERDHFFNNKLEMKRRGVENIDAKDLVDPRLTAISPYIEEILDKLSSSLQEQIIAARGSITRPRLNDADGNELPFFPDYYVLPVDSGIQYNPAGAVEALTMLQDLGGIRIERTTQPVTHDGVTYPAGTYVIDLRQGNRNVANSLLYPGYDANVFGGLYDGNTIISWPGQRGFNATRVWAPDLFDGKTERVDLVKQVELPGDSEYVVYKNSGHDAIRLTTRLLSDNKDVWMITGYVPGAAIGDFVARRADVVAKIGVMNNLALGPVALSVFGTDAGDSIPANTKQLVIPRILGARPTGTNAGNSGPMLSLVYDVLEFPTSFFDGMATDTGAVLVGTSAADDSAKIPQVIYSATAAIVNNANVLGVNAVEAIPTTGDNPVLVGQAEMLGKGTWSATSIVASNYGLFDQLFSYTHNKFTNPRGDIKVLAQFNTGAGGDIYLSGRKGIHNAHQYSGAIMAISGIKSNGAGVTAITENISDRGRYSATWNLFANSIFAYAAGIPDVPRPTVFADIPNVSDWINNDIGVQLTILAEDTADINETVSVAVKKFKVNDILLEPAYSVADTSWKDIPEDGKVTFDVTGVQYLHWYVENSDGKSSQGIFGPYSTKDDPPRSPGNSRGNILPKVSTIVSTAEVEPQETSSAETPIIAEPIEAPGVSFADVSANDWFANAVMWAYENDLMFGVSEEPLMFGPNMTLTRGMVATVLWRMEDSPEVEGASAVFTDVTQGSWYEKAVAWASQNEIVYGYGEGLFGPGDNITRQDLAVMLNRYAEFAGITLPAVRDYQRFNDQDNIADYAKESIERFYRATIVNGRPGNIYDPTGTATRAEFATMLKGFLETADTE